MCEFAKKDINSNSFNKASSKLEEFGFAKKKEDGRLIITESGFRKLASYSHLIRKKIKILSSSQTNVNLSWRGDLLHKIALAVCGLIDAKHANLTDQQSLQAVYKVLRAQGIMLAPSQLKYGLSIFKGCGDNAEVWKRAQEHRSYGDWWNTLSQTERSRIIESRNKSQIEQVIKEGPDKRSVRIRKTKEGLAANLESSGLAPSVFNSVTTEDLALKALEKRCKIGQTVKFSGVEEPMRSSWEALYARVIQSLPNRFYIYEPIGFPLIDPATGRIESYHPDFLEYRRSNSTYRFIEIKGELTLTGQRKIALFNKYYINSDFSGLSEYNEQLLKTLIEATKKVCLEQFGITFTNRTRIRVFGERPWNGLINNFEADNECYKPKAGMINRLRKRFIDCIPPERHYIESRKNLEENTRKLTNGRESWQLAKPGRPYCAEELTKDAPTFKNTPRIQRSENFFFDYCGTIDLVGSVSKIANHLLRESPYIVIDKPNAENRAIFPDLPLESLSEGTWFRMAVYKYAIFISQCIFELPSSDTKIEQILKAFPRFCIFGETTNCALSLQLKFMASTCASLAVFPCLNALPSNFNEVPEPTKQFLLRRKECARRFLDIFNKTIVAESINSIDPHIRQLIFETVDKVKLFYFNDDTPGEFDYNFLYRQLSKIDTVNIAELKLKNGLSRLIDFGLPE